MRYIWFSSSQDHASGAGPPGAGRHVGFNVSLALRLRRASRPLGWQGSWSPPGRAPAPWFAFRLSWSGKPALLSFWAANARAPWWPFEAARRLMATGKQCSYGRDDQPADGQCRPATRATVKLIKPIVSRYFLRRIFDGAISSGTARGLRGVLLRRTRGTQLTAPLFSTRSVQVPWGLHDCRCEAGWLTTCGGESTR